MHEKEFHPYMIIKILSNLSAWMRGKEIKPIKRRHSHNSMRNTIYIAAIDQQEIGWWHMLQGRISSRWEESYAKHMAQSKERHPEGKSTQIPALISQLWRVAKTIWKTRNMNKYGTNFKVRERGSREGNPKPENKKDVQGPIHHDDTIV